MKTKTIAFVKENTVELIEQEVRVPNAHEVLVKLCFSAISSGTERANLMGSKTVSWIKPEAKVAVFPRITGYSSSGIVEQVGDEVTDIRPGDRVALSWSIHSQYVTLPAKNVCRIDEISFEDAAMFHIGTFPLAAIRKCRTEIGESAVVMGMGVLGIVAVQLLRAAGAVPVIAVDPEVKKRQKALECGADYALDPFADDFAKTVKQLTGGGANVGIEVTGNGKGLDGILDCMARFGRVALLGCTRSSDFTIDYYRKVHGPGITLVGAHTNARPETESAAGWWTQADDVQALKKLTLQKRISFAAIVDEIHTPDEAKEVYERLVTQKTFPVVEFDWREFS